MADKTKEQASFLYLVLFVTQLLFVIGLLFALGQCSRSIILWSIPLCFLTQLVSIFIHTCVSGTPYHFPIHILFLLNYVTYFFSNSVAVKVIVYGLSHASLLLIALSVILPIAIKMSPIDAWRLIWFQKRS